MRKLDRRGERNRPAQRGIASYGQRFAGNFQICNDHGRSIRVIDHVAWEERSDSGIGAEKHLSAGALERGRIVVELVTGDPVGYVVVLENLVPNVESREALACA